MCLVSEMKLSADGGLAVVFEIARYPLDVQWSQLMHG